MYDRTDTYPFEWDDRKAVANLRKHGIDFMDASAVFFDELGVVLPERANGEHRFVTIGLDKTGRLLVVVWTPRRDRVRIISARKAAAHERAVYGKPR